MDAVTAGDDSVQNSLLGLLAAVVAVLAGAGVTPAQGWARLYVTLFAILVGLITTTGVAFVGTRYALRHPLFGWPVIRLGPPVDVAPWRGKAKTLRVGGRSLVLILNPEAEHVVAHVHQMIKRLNRILGEPPR